MEAVGALAEIDDAEFGKLKFAGLPFKLDGKPGRAAHRAPKLGEHTREVLREVGYDESRIASLIERNVVIG